MNEQSAYARWLSIGVAAGFVALVASFIAYLTGALPPGIPPARLPELWGLPVKEYVAATGSPTGWSWLYRLGEGDTLNFLGIAILCCATFACYARILPILLAQRSRALAWICLGEIAVLAAAASGLIYSNH
jgi:hypothetical protein